MFSSRALKSYAMHLAKSNQSGTAASYPGWYAKQTPASTVTITHYQPLPAKPRGPWHTASTNQEHASLEPATKRFGGLRPSLRLSLHAPVFSRRESYCTCSLQKNPTPELLRHCPASRGTESARGESRFAVGDSQEGSRGMIGRVPEFLRPAGQLSQCCQGCLRLNTLKNLTL